MDAGTSGPAPTPGTWCAGQTALLCDDFDTPARSEASWVADDGLVLSSAITSIAASSPPNAFFAKTAAISGPTAERSQIKRSSAGPDALEVNADVTFAVRIGALGTSTRTEIARVEGVNPIDFANHSVALLVSPSGASVEVASGPSTKVTPLSTAPRAKAWSHVAMHLVLERTVTGPATSVTIRIDDGAAESIAVERGMGVRPFLRLGLAVTGPADACEVAYDDVTYDAR